MSLTIKYYAKAEKIPHKEVNWMDKTAVFNDIILKL